jgi:predicted permease
LPSSIRFILTVRFEHPTIVFLSLLNYIAPINQKVYTKYKYCNGSHQLEGRFIKMFIVFSKVLVVFAMVAIGFAANKTKVLPEQAIPYLVKLLLVITSPCLIVYTMTQTELNSNTIAATKQILIGAIIYFILGSILLYIIIRLLHFKPAEDAGVYRFLCVAKNTGFMGFPITLAVFGSEGLFLMVLANIILTFYLYSLGLVLLNLGSESNNSFKDGIKAMMNLCMLAAVVGLGIFFLNIELPSFFMDITQQIGDITIPLAMIIVGIQLGSSPVKEMLCDKVLLLTSFINLIIMPAITFVAMMLIDLIPLVEVILVFQAAFPAAAVTVALVQSNGKNAQLAAKLVALTTLLSMITIPLIATFLTTYYKL